MIRKGAIRVMVKGVLVSDLSEHKNEHASLLLKPSTAPHCSEDKVHIYSLGIDTLPSLAFNEQVTSRDVY